MNIQTNVESTRIIYSLINSEKGYAHIDSQKSRRLARRSPLPSHLILVPTPPVKSRSTVPTLKSIADFLTAVSRCSTSWSGWLRIDWRVPMHTDSPCGRSRSCCRTPCRERRLGRDAFFPLHLSLPDNPDQQPRCRPQRQRLHRITNLIANFRYVACQYIPFAWTFTALRA